MPVLNEAENVWKIRNEIRKHVGRDAEIIFVDGGSKDNTIAEIQVMQKIDKNVKLLYAGGGIVGAVQSGIIAATNKKIIIMDADLQHPPKAIPKFAELLDSYDLVMGSRYIGGRIPNGWKTSRRIISRWAAAVTRILYPPARKISDPLTGFIALRKTAISPKDWPKIAGFKVSLLILRDVHNRGGKTTELYYEFGVRRAGSSKMSIYTIINWMLLLGLLTWETILRK